MPSPKRSPKRKSGFGLKSKEQLEAALELGYHEDCFTISGSKLIYLREHISVQMKRTYTLQVEYSRRSQPVARVLKPESLPVYERKPLPHVWSSKKQILCLYKFGTEYTNKSIIADTIIPWTHEWIWWYEQWLSCGKWLGPEHKH